VLFFYTLCLSLCFFALLPFTLLIRQQSCLVFLILLPTQVTFFLALQSTHFQIPLQLLGVVARHFGNGGEFLAHKAPSTLAPLHGEVNDISAVVVVVRRSGTRGAYAWLQQGQKRVA
jgi:hypothetical protein